ncbi:unnamed protein product [Chironomus riparius]|uniref:Choline transporter-like protein n=1 Tax=Chironomus riparius TaxID=315576 RepID=A0A9N9S7T8_9DIPT|nr:unnamed protein product [Chironomus riparius]
MSIEVKPSSERKCTNIPALVFAIVFIVITVILVIYCGIVASTKIKRPDELSLNDSNEVKDLKDSCGNICGERNHIQDDKCGDSDKTDYPKLLLRYVDDDDEDANHYRSHFELNECVKECPEDYIDMSNSCINAGDMNEMVNSLKATWYYILIICFVAFVFSYVFLILFRHAAKYVIWIINIGFVVLVVGLAILCAVAGTIEGAFTFGIMGLVLIGFLIFFRKRIALVAKLFKEASKALIDVPAVMFEPILVRIYGFIEKNALILMIFQTFISLLVSFLIFATFFVIISFAGEDEPVTGPAHACNLISFIFITQFIIGCQNFIIAGTIVRWYFTRDKTKLHKPIKKSFSHLFKFHLGSVCFGAILITIVKIIKGIISSLKNSAKDSRNIAAMIIATCCMCIFNLIEQLLAFLIRNAYVVVAKEGTGFCDSGRRAYRLLMDNITDVIALNHFGDLVLMVCRLLIVLIAGLVGYTLLSSRNSVSIGNEDHIILPMIFGCILAFLIAHCFVEVFEMTIDTIFISFCIDLEENDGQTKPYYMSESLKRIIMEMKEHSGGTLVLGPKCDPGLQGGAIDGSGYPMLQQPQPMYPNMGYNQQFYPQQAHPQQPMMPQPGYPAIYNANQTYPLK